MEGRLIWIFEKLIKTYLSEKTWKRTANYEAESDIAAGRM